MMEHSISIQKKMERQIQMTLEWDLPTDGRKTPIQVVSSGKEQGTKWYQWMNLCDEYVRLCRESGYLPSLEEVQKHMLSELGLRYHTTSLILRDLARVGRIQVIKNRVTPCK